MSDDDLCPHTGTTTGVCGCGRCPAMSDEPCRSKSFYARQALETHLDDLEDIYLGHAALEDVRAGRDQVHPLGELLATYDL